VLLTSIKSHESKTKVNHHTINQAQVQVQDYKHLTNTNDAFHVKMFCFV